MAPSHSKITLKHETDADQLVKADQYLGDLEPEEIEDAISSLEKLREWWQIATGVQLAKKGPTAGKWFDILTNQDWKDAALQYVSSSADASRGWIMSGFHGLMGHRYNEVWLSRLQSSKDFSEIVFPTIRNLVQEIDIKMISDLPFPRQLSHVRLLFYPYAEEYYEDRNNTPEYDGVDPRLFNLHKNRTRLKLVRRSFAFRRSGFLQKLSGMQYFQVFEVLNVSKEADLQDTVDTTMDPDEEGELLAMTELRTWTWKMLRYQEDEVAAVADALMEHVIFWYTGDYKAPPKGCRELDGVSWAEYLSENLFKDPQCDSESSTDDAEYIENTAIIEKAIDTVDGIVDIAEKYMGVWKSVEFKEMLQHPSIPGKVLGNSAEVAAAEETYRGRFAHKEWVDLLLLCQKMLSRDAQPILKPLQNADLPNPWSKFTALSTHIHSTPFWTSHTKPLTLKTDAGRISVTLESELQVFGLKFTYLQTKLTLLSTLRLPAASDNREHIAKLTSELRQCHGALLKWGFVVEPENMGEDLSGLLQGRLDRRGVPGEDNKGKEVQDDDREGRLSGNGNDRKRGVEEDSGPSTTFKRLRISS